MKTTNPRKKRRTKFYFAYCLVPLILALVSTVHPALSREKSDVITLKNGNRINGEIRELNRGMLTFKTDSMGTLNIKWEDVTSISSKFTFVVEDSKGKLYVGKLQAAADVKRVNIVGPSPGDNIDHISIVELSEMGGSIWKRLSGSAELGYTFTKANDRQQLNIASDLSYRAKRYEGKFTYDSIVSHSSGIMEVDRRVLTLTGSLDLKNKWQVLTKGAWEHNLELQLDKRVSITGAPAYDILKTNRSSLLLIGGVAWTQETYFEQPVKNNMEGAFGADGQFFKLYTPKIDLSSSFYVLPNFSTSGRVRTEFEANLRFEIFRDFFINFSFYDSYDNKPPTQTGPTNDYGFVTGVSWTFHR
jgi:hypothetical protein